MTLLGQKKTDKNKQKSSPPCSATQAGHTSPSYGSQHSPVRLCHLIALTQHQVSDRWVFATPEQVSSSNKRSVCILLGFIPLLLQERQLCKPQIPQKEEMNHLADQPDCKDYEGRSVLIMQRSMLSCLESLSTQNGLIITSQSISLLHSVLT